LFYVGAVGDKITFALSVDDWSQVLFVSSAKQPWINGRKTIAKLNCTASDRKLRKFLVSRSHTFLSGHELFKMVAVWVKKLNFRQGQIKLLFIKTKVFLTPHIKPTAHSFRGLGGE